jgi:hypothetical protein
MITPEAQSILEAFSFEPVGPDKNERGNQLFMAETHTQGIIISLPPETGKHELLEALIAAGRAQQRESTRDARKRYLDTFRG